MAVQEFVVTAEWKVQVGKVTITPTVMQQAISQWINEKGKSPGAIAQELNIGEWALRTWLRSSRTIPRNRVARFCELARHVHMLPAATAAELRLANPFADHGEAPKLAYDEKGQKMLSEHWPRLVRLFLKVKDPKTTGLRLEALAGIDKTTISRWNREGCAYVRPETARKLKEACKRHREWKRAKEMATRMSAPKQQGRKNDMHRKGKPGAKRYWVFSKQQGGERPMSLLGGYDTPEELAELLRHKAPQGVDNFGGIVIRDTETSASWVLDAEACGIARRVL